MTKITIIVGGERKSAVQFEVDPSVLQDAIGAIGDRANEMTKHSWSGVPQNIAEILQREGQELHKLESELNGVFAQSSSKK